MLPSILNQPVTRVSSLDYGLCEAEVPHVTGFTNFVNGVSGARTTYAISLQPLCINIAGLRVFGPAVHMAGFMVDLCSACQSWKGFT